jgi:FAD/FMN-containing dehydrogenase
VDVIREDLPPALVADLERQGVACATSASTLAGFARDWTGRWEGKVLGMVRPASTEQVTAVLTLAHQHAVPVHIQGGNTGLVGGSVPVRPSLLCVTTALRSLGQVDPLERTVVVGAGVTCAELAAHARAAGLHLGIDLAARDSATVGGMAATNAGGLEVVAFGMMRQQVRGLTVVRPDGVVLDTVGRPRKDNTGYDMTSLLVGSEGTLGVITAVEVALHPAEPAVSLGALAVADLASAASAARAVQAAGGRLLASEVVDRRGVQRAAQLMEVSDPLAAGGEWLLLLEVADGGSGEGLAPVGDAVVALATDAPDRARLWALRERQTELYAARVDSAPEKLDVSVRVADLDELVRRVRQMVTDPTQAGFFGHVLDGNLHVQLTRVPRQTAGRVLALVAELGGSISAEHGIGRMKASQLHLARTAEEVAWMRAIKAAVDPDGLLNAGVLFPI